MAEEKEVEEAEVEQREGRAGASRSRGHLGALERVAEHLNAHLYVNTEIYTFTQTHT